MARAIRAYLNEEITAFQFDETLCDVATETDDATVQRARRMLWFFYDDCKEHKIGARKEAWNCFHLWLLLLESGGEIETIAAWRKWHRWQGVAAVWLVTFLVILGRVGFGQQLIAYALPFGPPSMFLAWLQAQERRKNLTASGDALAPFPSVSALLAARRSAHGFVRRRYHQAIVNRRIRDPLVTKLMWVLCSMIWCMFSPIVLFSQMLPERESATRFKLP